MSNVINLREASGSNDIQITPEEALELAKSEPGLTKVIVIMINEDEGMSWYQGGGLSARDILWYLERAKNTIVTGCYD